MKDGPGSRAALVAGIVAFVLVAGILIWAALIRPEGMAVLRSLGFDA